MLFFRRTPGSSSEMQVARVRARHFALLAGSLALAGACGDDGAAGGAGGAAGTTASSSSATVSGNSASSVTASQAQSTTVAQSSSSGGPTGSSSSGMGGAGGSGGGPNLPDYEPESEPNNDFSFPDALPDGKLGFYGALDSVQDGDTFTIVAYAGDSLRTKISDGMGGCPAGNATFQLQVFDSDEDEIASVFGECPLLDGTVDTDLASLPADDTYFVRVTALQTVAFYVVEMSVPPPVCGDNVVHATEECDDGNMANGDGCDSACQREPMCGDGFLDSPPEECDDGNLVDGDGCDGACMFEGNYCGEAEPNNDLGQTNYIQGCDAVLGQITPVGDMDFFKFDIVDPGSSVRLEVTGLNPGTCPAGFDSLLELYNPAGVEILSDDQDGVDSCSLINPLTDAAARDLPVGTYRVAVSEWGNNLTSPPYVLRLEVRAPACGDGIIQSGEACDDGNTANGDGCSSTCVFEGCAESEPNNTTATADSTTACPTTNGSISPSGDGDFYQVDVTVPGSSIRVETTQVGGLLCGANNDTLVRLLNPAGMELGTDNDDGDGSCSLINPTLDAFAANLPIGTYFVKVEENGNNATLAGYAVRIAVNPPACGDGILQAGEACDDGNLVDGDFCDSMCDLAPGVCAETEPNDSVLTANPVDACILTLGGITLSGGVAEGDYFSVQVTVPGSSIRAQTVSSNGGGCPVGFDSVLRLYNPAGMELGSKDQGGTASCSLINGATDAWARNLPVGTYTIRVEDFLNNGAVPSYGLLVDVLPPGCGDGILVAPETCDDGNQINDDLCSNACTLNPLTAEVEPNNTIATATVLVAGNGGFTGAITPIGDDDYYAFTVPAGADVRLETGGVPFDPASLSCPGDTHIYFYNAAGVELANDDDDSSIGLCSLLYGTNDAVMNNLAGGTYYVKVERHLDSSTVPPYTLAITITP